MELYELRPDTNAFRRGWSLLSSRSRAALHAKAMAFDGEAVFIGSFNLDQRSAAINTEAGLYIESPELAQMLSAYMAAGVAPANSYRVSLDPKGKVTWETESGGQRVRYRNEPETGFRRRLVAFLWKLLPIDSNSETGRVNVRVKKHHLSEGGEGTATVIRPRLTSRPLVSIMLPRRP